MLVSAHAASSSVAASVFSANKRSLYTYMLRTDEAMKILKYVSTMLFVDYLIFRYIYVRHSDEISRMSQIPITLHEPN